MAGARDLPDAMARLRPHAAALRERWRETSASWKAVPARAWPARQPSEEELPALRSAAAALCGNCNNAPGMPLPKAEQGEGGVAASASCSRRRRRCARAQFLVATALVFTGLDPHAGLSIYRRVSSMAPEADDDEQQQQQEEEADARTDAMVACGICLVEGFAEDAEREDEEAVARDEREGLSFLQRAAVR